MKQYLDLCKSILEEGTDIWNERTKMFVRTKINVDLEYDVGNGIYPLVTTRKVNYSGAIAEVLGYLRGYSSAKQFRDLGTKTWDANANLNQDWLNNPNRKGLDDMGRVYGVQGRHWKDYKGQEVDQLAKIVANLSKGKDDRGEILTYYNPGEIELGCLRPCMHTFQFSLIDGTLHMHAFQRSCDVPLGLVYNMQQCYVMLALIAQITGHKPGKVYHKIVNAHIYENQIEDVKKQLEREPYQSPYLVIDKNIKTLQDIMDCKLDQFQLVNYVSHPPIKYQFAV